jgi:hypothetical protein
MEKFETIVIDTADIAWDYAERFVCSQASVTQIGDIPYGAGYAMLAKQYDEAFRMIVQLGYGLVLISHSTDKTFTDEAGKEFNKIVPTLNKRANVIVSRLCDIIGYSRSIQGPENQLSTRLFIRETPRFMAGSRFKYTPDFIDFTYENLVGAISDAIDRQMEDVGEEFFTDKRENLYSGQSLSLDYDSLIREFNAEIVKLRENYTEEEFKDYWAPRIVQISETHLGKGNKVKDCTRDQVEAIDLVLSSLRDLISKGMTVAPTAEEV